MLKNEFERHYGEIRRKFDNQKLLAHEFVELRKQFAAVKKQFPQEYRMQIENKLAHIERTLKALAYHRFNNAGQSVVSRDV